MKEYISKFWIKGGSLIEKRELHSGVGGLLFSCTDSAVDKAKKVLSEVVVEPGFLSIPTI